jgi:8-oxo-dGTP pyrophosphatase MutT (NUDIX family)
VTYRNPTPVTIGIIPSTVAGELILVERSDGGLALPGGYVDAMEDTATSLTREVREEMGIVLQASRWRLFFSSVTPDNKLLLFSRYPEPVPLPSGFAPNTEVTRILSAPYATPLKFPLHEAAIRAWLARPSWQRD